MAFIQQGTTVYSFAEYADVVAIDQRLFDANEGLTQDRVEETLVRSTERILDVIRNSDWWKSYYISKTPNWSNQVVLGQAVGMPALDPNLIRARRNDFTDLCVFYALSQYLYPSVADFGNPDSAERQKIGFYDTKYRDLLKDLLDDGDWYDFDASGTVDKGDKYPMRTNIVRVR